MDSLKLGIDKSIKEHAKLSDKERFWVRIGESKYLGGIKGVKCQH